MTDPGLPTRQTRNRISKIYGTVLIMLLLLVVFTIGLGTPSTTSAQWYNATAPIYLTAVTAFAAFRVARTLPAAMWSPAFWLLVSSAVFFGFGPLVETYGNYETQLGLSVMAHSISQVELFRSNRLSFISIFVLVFGFWLHLRLRRTVWRAALTVGGNRQRVVFNPKSLATAFIVGGMILIHVIIMPSRWGQLDLVVAGALTSIASIANIGFAIAAYLAVRGSKRMRWPLVLLWPLHLSLTMLSFAKAELIIALLLPAIGAYMGHRRILRLVVAAVVIAGIYAVSQDYVHYGRSEIYKHTATISQAGYGERIRIARDYFTTDFDESVALNSPEQEQGWWLRLNYSGVQAIGMRFRDQGVKIDSLSNVWTMFIPRFLWPGKPIYVAPGGQFYTLLTRNTGTYVGISVFGDVYWQFGWLGIIVIIPMVGWMFAMLSWRSIEAVVQLNLIRMPLVLISILMAALGLTKWLANGIIAAIPVYIGYLSLIILVERFVRAHRCTPISLSSHFSHASDKSNPETSQ